MKFKRYSKEQIKEKLSGEEMSCFIDDITSLSKGKRKQLRSMAYMIMQLKRLNRDEIKAVIGYTRHLDVNDDR